MQIEFRPEEITHQEQVGWFQGAPVFFAEGAGGYSCVYAIRNGRQEILGLGPHPGVSKGIARKTEPRIQWTQLAKSDEAVDPKGRIFKRYELITARLRARQG
jgi:hypothetical protein